MEWKNEKLQIATPLKGLALPKEHDVTARQGKF
jgi:hypothetical protein